MKTKVIILSAFALLMSLAACGTAKETPAEATPPAVSTTDIAIPANPTYEAEAAYDEDGMKSEYIYTFASGEIEVPIDAFLIMVNGEFIAEYIEADEPSVISQYTDGLENAVVTKLPAGLISKEPVIAVDTINPMLDTTALIAALKPQLQVGLDALKATDFETFSMGRLSDASVESLNATFDEIQAKIDDLSFIMQAGRYAIFDGPHTIVIDTTADNAFYCHYAGHAYGGLYVFDASDPESFMSGFFFG